MKKNSWILLLLINTISIPSVNARSSSVSLAVDNPPPAPALAMPSNGVISTSELLALSWSASTGASSYQLQVSSDPSFATVLLDTSGLTTMTELFETPLSSATYYWRVKATNTSGTSDWSTVWSVQVLSPHPRILLTSADIPTIRARYNSGGFPFSDFQTEIISKWNPEPNTNQEQVDYDRTVAQYAKVWAFRYMMEQNTSFGDRAYRYLSSIAPSSTNDRYVMDSRFDRWMTNGLALIDYCIAYDLLDGMGYFGPSSYRQKQSILRSLYARANALYIRAKNDRTLQQFLNDVTHSECHDVTFLGFRILTYCVPATTESVVQDALFHAEIGNIRIIVAAALGVAAHTGIASFPTDGQEWQQYAQKDIEHFLLKRKRYPDIAGFVLESQNVEGVFPEGIEYLNYAAEGFVPFLVANKLNGGEDYSQDVNFRKILDWSYDVQLPTGEAPQVNSSGFKIFPLSSLYGSTMPNGSNYLWQLQTFSQNAGRTVSLPVEGFCLLNNPPAPSPKQFSTLMSNPTQGQVIYRNTSPTPTKYVLVSAKNGPTRYAASIHSHAEAGSFIFADGNKLLVRQPGYSGHPNSAEYEKAISHSTICPIINNTIMYDGTDRSSGLPPTTDVTILNSKNTDDFVYTNESFDLNRTSTLSEGIIAAALAIASNTSLTFGYSSSAWMKSQANKFTYGNCNRQFLMVNNSYLIIRDGITSSSQYLQYPVSLIQGNNGDNTEASYANGTGPTNNGDEVYWNSGSGPILRVNTAALGGKISQFSGFDKAPHQNPLTRDVAYHAMFRTACSFNNNYGQILSILESDLSMGNKSSLVTKRNNDADNFLLYSVDGRNKAYGRYDIIFSQQQAGSKTISVNDLPNPVTTDASFLIMSFNNNMADVNGIKIFACNATYIRYNGYGFIPNQSGDAQTSFAIIPAPSAPALVSPANNATNVVTAPTLTWNAVSGATSYQIQVSKTSAFAAGDLMFDQNGLTSPSYAVPGLVTTTTYYWRVRGINAGGDGAWSEVRLLTTNYTITVNTVWSGQISLTQTAVVYSPATLTITAGTYLTMPPQKYISVASGNIIVQGTANSKVTLDGVTPGQWYWPNAPITLQGNSSATISYAEFKNSRTLLTSYFCTGSLTISNCTFLGQASNMYQATNDGYGIEIYNDPYLDPLNIGNINISNNTFTGNGNGYAIIANNVRPSSLTISNNTISNWYSGIYSWSVGKGAISGGSINNCTYGISMIGSTSTSPSSVSNVSIQGGIYGVYITDYDSPTIQYCSIQDAYQYGIYSNGWGSVRFIGNIISKTTQSSGSYGIYARGNSATIDNNNVSSYSYGIYATPDEYMIMGRDSIRWNNIHNVATAIVAYGVPTGVVVQNNIISANRTGTFAFFSYGSERIEYNKIISEGADPNYPMYYGLGVNGNYAPVSITKNEFSGFYGAIYFQASPTPSVYYSQNNLRSNYYSCISTMNVHFENNFVLSCPSAPGYFSASVLTYPSLSSPALGTGPGGGNNSFPSTCDGPYSQMNPGNGASEIKLAIESVSETPKEFLLSQNHPNPFNPETIIQYQLPKESFVSLRIYDVLGREVRRLVNQQQREGYYSSRWNGKNNVGEQVSSGVYIYRLVASSAAGESPFISTHKMILAR